MQRVGAIERSGALMEWLAVINSCDLKSDDCKSRQRTSNVHQMYAAVIYYLRSRMNPRNRRPRSARCHDRVGFRLRFQKIVVYSPPTLTRGTRCINARARGTVECIRLPNVAIRGWIVCVRSYPHVLFWSREERLRNLRFLHLLINDSGTLDNSLGCSLPSTSK